MLLDKQVLNKHALQKMFSVTNGSFLSTEILAPGSQGMYLTFIVKQFFRFLKASISRTKNVKKYLFTL